MAISGYRQVSHAKFTLATKQLLPRVQQSSVMQVIGGPQDVIIKH